MKRLTLVLAVTVACMFCLSVSGVMAQVDYCEGNFDYDQDQDGTDAFAFKTDFGRGAFLNPCPPDGPAPVPKTGQTLCYDSSGTPRDCANTGEDGEYRQGVDWPNPRFIDHGDGTVTDDLTGLMWTKDAKLFAESFTWQAALDICNSLDYAGHDDWRLPNRFEFGSLLDLGRAGPALPSGHPFTNWQWVQYWSSTTGAFDTASAWLVHIARGYIYFEPKETARNVWPVRGGRTTSRPLVTITQPTAQPTYSTEADYITLAGTASDDVGVVGVTWSNSRGGSGTASGTTNWSIADITLLCGNDNIITVIAEDTDANTGSDVLTVDVKPCPPGL